MRSVIEAVAGSRGRQRFAGLSLLLAAVAALSGLGVLEPAQRTSAQSEATETLIIRKVNLGGNASEVFTGTYTGPVSGTFSVSQDQQYSVLVPPGTYTITEDAPVGSTYVGGFAFNSLNDVFCTDAAFDGATNHAEPGPVSITLTSGSIFPQRACLLNERATLRVHKVNLGGSSSEVFTGTYTGPVSGTFSVSEDQPFSVTVPLGTYTVTEDTGPGSFYVGGFDFVSFGSSDCSSAEATDHAEPGPVTVTFNSGSSFPPRVCLLNERVTLRVQKVNLGGSSSEVFTGTYAGPVSGTFSVSESQPFSVVVPLGTYTVTEDTGPGSPYVGGFSFNTFESSYCSSAEATDHAEPGPVTLRFRSDANSFTPRACLLNQRATLRIHKVNLGGDAAEVFTGTYSGPVSGTFSVSQAQPFTVAVPLGTYVVTEDAKPGVVYRGGFTYDSLGPEECSAVDGPDGAEANAQPGSVTVTYPSIDMFPDRVCLLNEVSSEVIVTKHDDVDAAHGGNAGQWQFSVDGGGAGFAVVGVPRTDGTTQSTSHKFGNVPASGTVMELAGNPTACFDQLVKTYQTNVGAADGPLGISAPFSSTPGVVDEVHFYNTDCGVVLGAGVLDVVKVDDLNGNGQRDAGEGDLNWNVTVSCPGEADRHGVTPVQFTDLPNNATCTVTESPAAGYAVIGWDASDLGTATGLVESSGAGTSTTVHADDGDLLAVTFYNQALVTIRATKTELSGRTTRPGAGWEITVTGCGVNETLETDSSGVAEFSDLPLCVYTVRENPTSKPGFGSLRPVSVEVNATEAGQTFEVRFANVTGPGECGICENPIVITLPPPPTATPTPGTTPTPPPATTTGTPSPATPAPSATQPPSASSTAAVTPPAGASPPAQGTAGAAVTPRAPSAGAGSASQSTNGGSALLALLGAAMLVAGAAGVKAGRRR